MSRHVVALLTSFALLPGALSPAAADELPPSPREGVSTVELDLAGVAAGAVADLPEGEAPAPQGSGDVGRRSAAPDGAAAPDAAPAPEAAAAPEAAPAPQDAAPGPAAAQAPEDDAPPAAVDAVLTEPLDADPFTVMGFSWDGAVPADDVSLRYRVREDGEWTEWAAVETGHHEADHAADHAAGGGAGETADETAGDTAAEPPADPHAEDATGAGRVATDAVVVDDADGLQVWAQTPDGSLPGFKVVLIDPGADPAAMTQAVAAAPGAPAIIPRAQWGADERQVTCEPEYGASMMAATVHHSASTNGYGPEDVAGMIRGMLAYHTRPEANGGRGWCDIGYNFLVDRFGRIFEGRRGGADKPVVGVHVGGFNSRSIGVSAIGEFGAVEPSAQMLESISRLIAWKFVVHRIDPAATVVMISGGGASLYPEGTPVRFSTVYGHRDAAGTSCPGQRLYDRLPTIRARVVELVGASLAHSPRGAWESVVPTAAGVTVSGWALDPDTSQPITVDVQVDGVGTRFAAGLERADVGAANPGAGTRHGFSATVPAASGTRVVCLSAIDSDGSTYTQLGCRRVRVDGNNPRGSLDTVEESRGSGILVTGWVVDPDTAEPVTTHVYLDGVPVAAWRADAARADVGALYPALGPNHGYAGVVPAGQGRHTVCVYGINVGSGGNALLGCRDVVVSGSSQAPMGELEAVVPYGDRIVVQGWALDPDTAASIDVHLYVDGRPTVLGATAWRPDVRARFPGQSPSHGFTGSVAVAEGQHTVCAYGIDANGSQNALLGCRDVTVVNRAPQGTLDWTGVSAAGIHVAGWAFDPDTAAPIPVHVYLDGVGVAWTADRGRADVQAAYPGQGPAHGYEGVLPAGRGDHTVCVYAINASPGVNTLLGCRAVRV